MKRFSLAISAVFMLSGCVSVRQQQIVEARLGLPEPPVLPILPLDSQERMVLQGGAGMRVGSLPRTGILDDSSGQRLGLDLDRYGAEGAYLFHYKLLLAGTEISSEQVTVLAGLNVQGNGFQVLPWLGVGAAQLRQDVKYRQTLGNDNSSSDTTWNVLVRKSGTSISPIVTGGISVVLGNRVVRPFLAPRFIYGQVVDGKDANDSTGGSAPAATNAIDLDQIVVDGGVRIEVTRWVHAFVGAGYRTFLSSEIPGYDWRLYAGVGCDLWRSRPEAMEDRLERIRSMAPPRREKHGAEVTAPVRPDTLSNGSAPAQALPSVDFRNVR